MRQNNRNGFVMQKKIKIVVVGPGLIGKTHISNILSNHEAELAGIVAPDHIHNHEYCNSISKPLFFNLIECIRTLKPDGVIISSPNEFHYEQAMNCINSNIPTLLEKPITSTLEDGALLVSKAESRSVPLMIGHHRAHSPILSVARDAIRQGLLGQIVSVIGSAQFYKPKQYFLDGPWRSQTGGGPILINLIHEIGNLRSLIGEISEVQAICSSNIRKFDVEDTVGILFKFTNGAIGTFMLSDTAASCKSWEQTSLENSKYSSHNDENCYYISGTKGSLSVPTMKLLYFDTNTEPSWWNNLTEKTLNLVRDDPLKCQLKNFIEVIKGTEKPLVTGYDGLKNLKIVDSIMKSAKFRKPIEV